MFGAAAPKLAVNPLLQQVSKLAQILNVLSGCDSNDFDPTFQQPKPGSRPGPSTGPRPMTASQKVKNIQGQQRPKPSPPPAKKMSGPGGVSDTGVVVREDDFEEDDVICID